MSRKIRKTLGMSALASALAFTASMSANATDFSVEITNLTQGVYFTPILVAAHPAENSLFTSGMPASANLETMAEGGDISGLTSDLEGLNATIVGNPAGGLLAPGASTTADLNTDTSPANTNLSIVAMMLPTNDGFIGLNSISVPTEAGTYTYNVNAYDAGTEANDELLANFPAPGPVADAVGANGTGIVAEAETFVHIHRNVLGDTDETGGASDIDSVVHRWLNPVARVVITVN